MEVWKLLYGINTEPVLTVIRDVTYPSMWRVRMPDGRLTDMVNLARAKDAATLIAARDGYPHALLRWKAPI